MPKFRKTQAARKAGENVRFSLGMTLHALSVADAQTTGVLKDVLLMEGDREATGHGFYIDSKTLDTAFAAIQTKGGKLRGYYTHDHRGGWMPGWNDFIESSGSELAVPGFFDAVRVEKNQLIAGQFSFYDSFKALQPDTVAQLLEMASKTPDLLGQSLELGGYLVFVDKQGYEYSEEPSDRKIELMYNGMPVLRVTDVFGSAFVAQPAAADGLFAKLSAGNPAGLSAALFAQRMKDAVDEWLDSTPPETLSATEGGQNNKETKVNILKALKAAIKDEARLARALTIVARSEDPDALTVAQVEAQLAREDAEQAATELAAKKAETEQLAAKKAELEAQLASANTAKAEIEAKFTALKGSGLGTALSTGGPASAVGKRSGFTGLSAKVAERMGAEGKQLSITQIGDLWIPPVWVDGMAEPVVTRDDIFSTGVVVRDPRFDAVATGGGTQGELPNFREPDFADEIQVEGTGPTVNKIGSGKQVCPILNRVSAVGATALAGAVSNSDPLGYALSVAGRLRRRQRVRTLLSMLGGLFGDGAATVGAFDGLRKSVAVSTGTPTTDNLISSDVVLDTVGLFGEAKTKLANGGCMYCHSAIETALAKQDDIDYVRDSEGKIVMRSYKGMQVFVDDTLVRTVSGIKIYTTYFFSPGSVALGDKPQVTYAGESESVASITSKVDEATNERTIYDRTRFVLQPNGAKWTPADGVPAGQSATNAELATKGNWTLAFADVRNVGIAQLETNG